MPQVHLWSVEAREALLEAIQDGEHHTLEPADVVLVASALSRYPLDTIVQMDSNEEERLSTEAVPLSERSDAALILLLADLTWGPGYWLDSWDIAEAAGETFSQPNRPED